MPPSNYRIPHKELWTGRSDGSGSLRIHEVITCVDMSKSLPINDGLSFGLLGFASDEGVKRNLGNAGAFEGPGVIRQALAGLPLPQQNMRIYDFGDVVCNDTNLEQAQKALSIYVSRLLANNTIPILLGGGHEIAWGHYQGIVAAYPTKKMAIFNFDAHFDLREPLEGGLGTSGTSFNQIAQHAAAQKHDFHYNCFGIQRAGNTQLLFKQAKKHHVKYVMADEFHLGGIETALELIEEQLSHVEIAYVTVCMDLFAAAFAPGVSAPQPLGLFPWHVIPLLQRLTASGKVVGIDIAELSPKRDIGNMTAQLAGQLLYHALNKFHLGSHL